MYAWCSENADSVSLRLFLVATLFNSFSVYTGLHQTVASFFNLDTPYINIYIYISPKYIPMFLLLLCISVFSEFPIINTDRMKSFKT